MNARRFTPDEANALLPELREQLAKLRELVQFIQTQEQELHGMKSHPVAIASDPFFLLEGRIDFMRMEAQLVIDNFARAGVLLKRIEPGLLDFPAVIDGEDVLICWKEGEERVAHYHGWNDGFAGRRRLPE
ncbi:DUF2203 domain-containing protein [Cohnella panacarvi]|uniref:DUF2203 domain-containing protein n=1 Tax=Cohnella panacarvi TaxID=400776 RepID=UPI0004796967|nr:DUF2203 domain-containing protein [Cohnella panacarvi]